MIWIVGTALVAIVGLALAAPMWRARAGLVAPSGAARDVAVYRDQLRGIEADAAAGRLGAEEAARLRAEVGRRLLEADRAERRAAPAAAPAAGPGRLTLGLALAGLAVVLAGSLALYARLGAPDMPDAPRSARLEAAQQRYDSRPSQAEAEAEVGPSPVPAPQAPQDFLDLMEQLRTRMAETPEPRGLRMLADYEARLGNLAAAQDAFRRLIALEPGAATADDHVGLATLMIETAGGLITPEAEAEIDAALARDMRHPQARFLKGLLYGQTGRPDRTFEIWRGLLEEGPPGAPWLAPIRQSIGELAWLAGNPGYQPPAAGTGAPPGPDAGAVAAAEAMSPEERAAMIAGMVAGLEDRVAREGGSAEEWARLVTALSVQGEAGRAGTILAEARTIFAEDAAALATLAQAARDAGLE